MRALQWGHRIRLGRPAENTGQTPMSVPHAGQCLLSAIDFNLPSMTPNDAWHQVSKLALGQTTKPIDISRLLRLGLAVCCVSQSFDCGLVNSGKTTKNLPARIATRQRPFDSHSGERMLFGSPWSQ